jgi:hypothetical protein
MTDGTIHITGVHTIGLPVADGNRIIVVEA